MDKKQVVIKEMLDYEFWGMGIDYKIEPDEDRFNIMFPDSEHFNKTTLRVLDIDEKSPEFSDFEVLGTDMSHKFDICGSSVKHLWIAMLAPDF